MAGLRDRAQVLLDGQPVALLDRNEAMGFNLIVVQGQRLDFIVENMGRINFGLQMIGQIKVDYKIFIRPLSAFALIFCMFA